jgi:hypothetical protein
MQAFNTNSTVLDLIRSGLWPTIYHTWGESANYYTSNAVLLKLNFSQIIKNVTAISIFGFLSYYSLPSHILVLVDKTNMFFHKRFRMELKCHLYDISNVDDCILPYKNDARYEKDVP